MRLTERDEYGNADIIGVDSADIQLNLAFDELNLVTDALNKLARYEDTGLKPEQIEALQQQLEPLQGKAVLIIGDMPESCLKCKLSFSRANTGKIPGIHLACRWDNKQCPETVCGRRTDCPLRIVGGGADETERV